MSEGRIEAVSGIESNYDVVLKILPALAAGVDAAAEQAAKQKDIGVEDAAKKLRDVEAEQRNAETELAEVEETASEGQAVSGGQEEPQTQEQPGGPRGKAEIQGMRSDQSSDPIEEEGLEAKPPTNAALPSPIPITRSWFNDNFGMGSAEVSELLIKANRMDALEVLEPLIMAERYEIVKQFPDVDPSIVDELPLTDRDYEQLNKNADRFSIHFRQMAKAWVDSEDEEIRQNAVDVFRRRIDKSHRLSPRENTILQRCADVMDDRGAVNAQTLKSYGVSAPPKEIAKLIRSHGFLFDIIKAGQGKKADERSLFYDIERADVLIKNCGRFIGALLDSGGDISVDSRGIPRLTIPFSGRNAPAYADAIKSEMAVNAVKAEGAYLIIEGENAVGKALSWSIPSMVEKRDEAVILHKAIQGDSQAQMILSYNRSNGEKQIKLLKQWDWSMEILDQVTKEVVADGTG